MGKYIFLFRGGDAARLDARTDADAWQAHMLKWRTWMESLGKSGNFVGGEPLEQRGATVVGRAKKVTDGPFAEGKEIVGGYVMVTAESLEHAIELSKGCPIFEHDGIVEVRPVQKLG